MLYQYDAQMLLPTSDPWWFMGFGSHPTYVSFVSLEAETGAGWSPFLSLLAKLSTFVCGMVAAQLYLKSGSAGWRSGLRQLMICLGAHSYSYFLFHNFGVGRTINLLVGSNLSLYLWMLPIMVAEALIFSVLADYTTPLIQRIVGSVWRSLNRALVASGRTPRQAREQAQPLWPRLIQQANIGNRVRYRGESWTILNLRRLDDQRYVCLGSDQNQTVWLKAEELQSNQMFCR